MRCLVSLTALLTAMASLACDGGDPTAALLVEVQTDFVPGIEFAAVRITATRGDDAPITRALSVEHNVAAERAFADGSRVAELEALPLGDYRVVAALSAADGSIVGERTIAITVDRDRGVTIVIHRSCGTATCPGAGPSELSTCVGGVCADPGCTRATPSLCPRAECATDGDCAAIGCGRGRCTAERRCLVRADSSGCATMDRCDPVSGECVATVVHPVDGGEPFDGGAPTDAGMTDAGEWDAEIADGSVVDGACSPIDAGAFFHGSALCTSTSDRTAIARTDYPIGSMGLGTVNDVAARCISTGCFSSSDRTACIAACVHTDTDGAVSNACAICYAGATECVAAVCLSPCISDLTGPGCVTCRCGANRSCLSCESILDDCTGAPQGLCGD